MGNFLSGGQEAGYSDIIDAIKQAQTQQRGYYQEAVGRLQPYMAAGTRGLEAYERGLAPLATPQQFYKQMLAGYQTSPATQQELQQAEQAARYGGLATGMYGSGAQRKALADVAQQLTARDIGDYAQRMMGIYGMGLAGQQQLAQAGQLAGTQAGQWGMMTGQDIANLQAQIGQARYGQDVARQQGLQSLLSLGLAGITGGFEGGGGAAGRGITGALAETPPATFTMPTTTPGRWAAPYMPTGTPSWAAGYLT